MSSENPTLISNAQSQIDDYTNRIWSGLLFSVDRRVLIDKASARMPADKVNAFIGYAIGRMLEKHKEHYAGDDDQERLKQALYDLQGLSSRELAWSIDGEMDALLAHTATRAVPPRTR